MFCAKFRAWDSARTVGEKLQHNPLGPGHFRHKTSIVLRRFEMVILLCHAYNG